ncbi:MAG TPA: glycosyltransferase family 39 protein [Pyrinomonadaceae bacterium]|nr:glycosyltransferase family 39 protein [Pyrinomonadaceae bacterium]
MLTRILARLPLISLLAVLWLSCFSGLAKSALVDLVDEGFYATLSRQMLETGDWITPRAGPQVYLEKPPLFYWAQALFIRLLGPGVLAARLPSALAVAATSLILWFWMRKRGHELAGWLAAIFYALCPLAMGMAHIGMTDALLTLWLTLAIIGSIEGYSGKRAGYLLMALGAGMATLTKGPIGFLLPGATFVLWLTWKRDLKELRKPIWLLAAVLFTALVLPWHLAAWRANGDYFLREYFWQNHVQRLIGRAFGHERPIWFYVPVLVCASFPFIAFVPRAWWKEITKAWHKNDDSNYTAMWALWAPLVLLFFSLSASKLPNYILPVLPALAVLVGLHVAELLRERRALGRLEGFVIGLGMLISLVLVSCGVLGLRWRGAPSPIPYSAKLLSGTIGWQSGPMNDAQVWYRLSPFTVLAPHTLFFGLLLLASTVLILLWRRNMVRVVSTAATLCLCLAVTFAHVAMPAWSRFDIEPLWQLAERAGPSLQAGEPLILYGFHPRRTSVRFLLGHPDLITETTDAPVLQQVVGKYPRGRILTIDGSPLPGFAASVQVERTAGRWVLWRFEH